MLNNFAGSVATTPALRPQSISGSSDVNGITIDKRALGTEYQFAKFAIQAGAVGGGPSAFTATTRIQHSDASGSGWADISDTTIAEAALALSAANTEGEISVNLKGTKRYVRCVTLPAFTGGSSPSVLMSAALVLGEPRVI